MFICCHNLSIMSVVCNTSVLWRTCTDRISRFSLKKQHNANILGSYKNEQVAQLWQRDRAKLDAISINVQRYSQNHAEIANFRWKGTSPNNLIWYQKTRLITILCDVPISVVCFFSFRHKARVWQTDGRTDRRTDGITIPKTALA